MADRLSPEKPPFLCLGRHRAQICARLIGPEKSTLSDGDVSFHQSECERLRGELQAAHDASQLPELPAEETRSALDDLLVRVRLAKPGLRGFRMS